MTKGRHSALPSLVIGGALVIGHSAESLAVGVAYNAPMPGTLTPEILARIDNLELDAKQVVEGYLAGRHRSPRHGFAVEFAQHREYAPGDDTRHIDWKVYARTERYQLKQYEQETNLVAWMVVDASESMAVSTVK